MSVRQGALDCKELGCNLRVASGMVADSMSVWELQLDDSVTDAYALSDGMTIGDFYDAVVQHRVKDGKVEHSIVKKQV